MTEPTIEPVAGPATEPATPGRGLVKIPDLCLVVLIGRDAFEVLHFIAAKRLAAGRLTVIDATSVQPEARRSLIALARAHHVLAVAIVLDLPEQICSARNAARPDRDFGAHVLRQQHTQLRRGLKGLRREGFHRVYVLSGDADIAAATVTRERLWNDLRDRHGPFDVIGDVHGCYDELVLLLDRLGYQVTADGTAASHPAGRTAVFVGDLVDRGPATPAVLRLIMGMKAAGSALCVAGNHEAKLVRALRGRNVTISHGLAESLAQLAADSDGFAAEAMAFMDGLLGHLVLDDGKLVVAHAGLPAAMHGRAMVAYGHTPVPEPEWVNGTICLDTGCVFGGKLTALRYPERELVSVPAARVYYEPARPLIPTEGRPGSQDAGAGSPNRAPAPDGAGRDAGELNIDDVIGKRIVQTRLTGGTVTIREENALAALEVMSRFAIDPRWLIYLPPTMAPTATASEPGLLEHPREALAAFRADSVAEVVCEEKHMGSRAVVIACKDDDAAKRRFGVSGPGAIYTRTGRAFFADETTERELLGRVTAAIAGAGLWAELDTDWVALDCELMPWSAKAGELLRRQYAPVAAAASAAQAAAATATEAAVSRGVDAAALRARIADRRDQVARFADAYRRYCWPVRGTDDLALAPFQFLASEQGVLALQSHAWHLGVADRLCEQDPVTLRRTAAQRVILGDDASESAATRWWEELTAAGGEGMVVKPAEVVHRGPKGPSQPGIKCRGPEYLRIIYGPEYLTEVNLSRLRSRNVSHKRSLALREFALGIEALERFSAGEPLYRVHECVFGVLALESEPVDPRL